MYRLSGRLTAVLLFVVIALAVIVGLHFVIYRRVAVAPQWSKRVRLAIAVTIAVLAALFFGGWRSLWSPLLSPDAARPLAWVGMIWLAFGLYLALGLLVVAAAAGIAHLRGSASGALRANRIGSLVAIGIAAVTTTWGVADAANLRTNHYEVYSDQLPSQFDGTRVVVLSDLHIGAVNSDWLAEQAVTIANSAEPDIVILAGDLVEGSPLRYGHQLAPLADLQAPMGVYAVTGNHEFISGDAPAWIEIWEQLGITVLQNESVTISADGANLHIAGVHDAMGSGSQRTDPAAALAAVPVDEFVLYLAHQPSQAHDAQDLGVDLQISGHTHGGQLWPMHLAVMAVEPMLSGQAMVGDIEVVTSRGAGTWGPPVRVGAPPEIPVITLRSS